MSSTLALFSGLPGTGKTTLAEGLRDESGWPLLAVDDLAAELPSDTDWAAASTWDRVIASLLEHTERVLRSGSSVIVDSVFMDLDRFHARAIADATEARFRPVYTFVSSDEAWKQRVIERFESSDPVEGVASWDQIQTQRRGFRPWEPGRALFVDGMRPIDENQTAVRAYVFDPDPGLIPLDDLPFAAGRYHVWNGQSGTIRVSSRIEEMVLRRYGA